MFSKRQAILWAITLMIVAIPYVGLMVVGAYTLWRNGWVFIYGIITAAITAAFFVAVSHYRRKAPQDALKTPLPACPEDWPSREREAWQKVEDLAAQAEAGQLWSIKLTIFRIFSFNSCIPWHATFTPTGRKLTSRCQ